MHFDSSVGCLFKFNLLDDRTLLTFLFFKLIKAAFILRANSRNGCLKPLIRLINWVGTKACSRHNLMVTTLLNIFASFFSQKNDTPPNESSQLMDKCRRLMNSELPIKENRQLFIKVIEIISCFEFLDKSNIERRF